VATYLSRSAWTSTSAGGSTLSGSKLRGVAVHWPGTTQDVIGDPGQASIASRIRSYRNFHVNTRGWADIGYNFAIDQAGRVWMLRSTSWAGNRVGAHCASKPNPDANHEYVGVLLILGDRETPSAAMLAAFRDWYRNRFLPIWRGRTDVRGHGKVPGASTSCPGTRALNLIASGAFTSGTTTTPEDTFMAFINNQAEFDAALSKWWNRVMNVNGAAVSPTPETTRLRAAPIQQVVGRIQPDGSFVNVHSVLGAAYALVQAFAKDGDPATFEKNGELRTLLEAAAASTAAVDPQALATALAPLLPVVDQDDLEGALRTVLGSVDEVTNP
jgi:hypothetical protein